MKTWNAPEVKELNINETANGFFNSDIETILIFNDSKKPSTPKDNDKDDDKDPVNQLS